MVRGAESSLKTLILSKKTLSHYRTSRHHPGKKLVGPGPSREDTENEYSDKGCRDAGSDAVRMLRLDHDYSHCEAKARGRRKDQTPASDIC